MKKFSFLFLLVLITIAVSACAREGLFTERINQGSNPDSPALGEVETIKLYYYNPEFDQDENGNIKCSEQGLVSVEREIGGLSNLSLEEKIRVAVDLLLRGELSLAEQSIGITTEFPLPGLEVKGFSLADGVLILNLLDPENQTSGGACRVSVLWAQTAATAKQFPEVDEVRFSPDYLFQP